MNADAKNGVPTAIMCFVCDISFITHYITTTKLIIELKSNNVIFSTVLAGFHTGAQNDAARGKAARQNPIPFACVD